MKKLLAGKMTMKAFSVASGIPYPTVKDYNVGKMPSIVVAVTIAKTLNCSLIEVAEAFGCDVKGLPYA